MHVLINGESRELPDGTTAAQMLEALKVQPERVVVELNLNILKRAQLPGAVLKEGDRVEIVHFVGGGSSHITTETRKSLPARRALRQAGTETQKKIIAPSLCLCGASVFLWCGVCGRFSGYRHTVLTDTPRMR